MTTTACLHMNIATWDTRKPSCIDCGLVQEIYQPPYVRSITHYRELFKVGRNPPVHCIKNPILQNQISKYHTRVHNSRANALKNNHSTFEDIDSVVLGVNEKDAEKFYSEYIQFLYDNENLILPNKTRIRPIRKIYGEHRQILLKWISSFLDRPLVQSPQ